MAQLICVVDSGNDGDGEIWESGLNFCKFTLPYMAQLICVVDSGNDEDREICEKKLRSYQWPKFLGWSKFSRIYGNLHGAIDFCCR